MNNLEKYLDQVIEQKPVVYEPPAEVQETPPTSNLMETVRRRWPIVVVVTLLIMAVGLPGVWFLVEPVYIVQGLVRVKPVVPGILDNTPSPDELSNYVQFVHTQALLLMSDEQRLQKIVDDLAGRNLAFFSGRPGTRLEKLLAKVLPRDANELPDQILRKAIAKQTITAGYLQGSELMAVTMKSRNIDEARTIVNSFLRNYVGQYGVETTTSESQNITILENQKNEYQKRIAESRQKLRELAMQYGSTGLDALQAVELQTQSALQSRLTQLEADRVKIEADIGVYEKTETMALAPEQIVAARTSHINSDPMVTELSTNIVQMERELLAAQQTHLPANPVYAQRVAVLKAFQQKLEERRKVLAEEFDANLENKLKEAAQQRVLQAKAQKAQIEAHIDEIRRILSEQQVRTVKMGTTNLDLQDLQRKVEMDEQVLDRVNQRLRWFEMERDRRPRVQIASLAEMKGKDDDRPKYAGMVVFVALGCGLGLALLRDKTDKTIQTPADILRQTDLPILGTTTSSRTVKPALFAEQIASDYQTIRTNLGLLYNGGMPKRLVVSSPGMREGKTTFAVNLATSLAKSGKKVLLIDGDLRKPDIGHMLNVLNNTSGLQNVLLGEDPNGIVCVLPSSGLHVLAANPRYTGDAYELLTSSTASEQMERLGREYDHLIVDSPPALAFPDALVWAKLTDAVILVSFAGQTTAPDLKEAKERFARIRARILGAVVSNVPVDQGLYRQGYTYRSRSTVSARKTGKPKKLLLSSSGSGGDRPAN
ncbi:MAG TPA: polysaccharide biosynthesis tyrosine autokinase [Sedimentisphaerales bacterium]|nr:polysaccharide biosynthesis tyrosine autokinase [Sedimentisphaerales bacterium]HQI27127.1 polysaccharide biosynthesis tyrosine autokinase [Sedimentisphaerales bacterium]